MGKPDILILGANGQLGQALQKEFPEAEAADRSTLDIADPNIVTSRNWHNYGLILNAAAYTAVDQAETPEGKEAARATNATAPQHLAQIALDADLTVVHISSDYVFDGTKSPHTEDEPFNAIGVYGQTKADGDIAISAAPKHYIVRTSWVIGEGKNFVRIMEDLASKGVKPSVVNDQIGRLTFTEDLAKGIKHLVETNAPFGTYNLSNEGPSVSWADIASKVYELTGHDASDVTGVTTAQYYEGKEGIAPRPLQSTLSLDKIEATGFTPRDWRQALTEYLKK